jgi:putative nucleotidyltransferase with HDIG domain
MSIRHKRATAFGHSRSPLLPKGGAMTRTAGSHDPAQQAVEDALQRTRRALIQTIHVVSAIASRSDRHTALHQEQVATLAARIGQRLGLEAHRLEGLYLGALVHDIGKIAVPAELISKPGKLTPEEFALVKTHVQAGVDMLQNVELPWPVQMIIGQHHERLDGSGYPLGLTGAAIAIEARICAVADVFEAICQPRPYREARGCAEALAVLEHGAGIAYDCETVKALASLVAQAGTQNFWTYINSADFSSTVLLPQLSSAHLTHQPTQDSLDPRHGAA